MRYLTKTRFKSAIECVTKLNYFDDDSFDNAMRHDELLLALAEGGHQLGALAKSLFPEGIEVFEEDHDRSAELTMELLGREEVAIFEAAFKLERLFIRVDLLHKHGDCLQMYEVKAKSYDSSEGKSKIVGARGKILQEFKPYILDVAFQRHVIRQLRSDLRVESYLVLPDKSKTSTQGNLLSYLPLKRDGRRVTVQISPDIADGKAAREILHILPVDTLIDNVLQDDLLVSGKRTKFAEALQLFVDALDKPSAPAPSAECRNCEYRAESSGGQLKDGRLECWSAHFGVGATDLPPTVFDLYAFSGKRTEEVIGSGRVKLNQMTTDDIGLREEVGKISQTNRQWLQCLEARDLDPTPFILRDELAKRLSRLEYPLHFIDFETARSPIPYRAGEHPYQMSFFQFSHHAVYADGRIVHATEYIDLSSNASPNANAVRALMGALSVDGGSVLHWWDYERTVLSEMKREISAADACEVADKDELIAFIDNLLNERLVDLGRKIVHETVFMPGTNGKSSIKLFLPAILNHAHRTADKYSLPIYGTDDGIFSHNFRGHQWVVKDANNLVRDPYELLGYRFEDNALSDADKSDDDVTITNGGAAMIAYGLILSGALDDERAGRLKTQLLRYCELDTLAMVMTWECLRELVEI